jgi:hypothetical protein
MSLGIIGEYLGRMFDETKRRPLYLVNHYQPSTLDRKSYSEFSIQDSEAFGIACKVE